MKIRFNGKSQKDFFVDVKKKVDSHFKENNISKHANGEMIFKTVFFLTLLFGFYGLIVFEVFSLNTSLLLAILLGMVHAFIGFNICHDAIHGSYSSNKTVNRIFSLTFNLIGANPYVWNVSHNIAHHTFTNIPGHDEDLEVAPGIVRLCPEDKWRPFMKFQHLYAFFLYSLASLSWVFRKDYVKFFQDKIGETDNSNHPQVEYFNLFFFKFVYYAIFIIIPLVVMDITWWQFIIGFLAMHIAEGLVLGLVFQLAHVVEGPQFPEPGVEGEMDNCWAVHQMNTTANFARKSFLARFFCGGLNFQIEHHLFPNICHVHYPVISEMVKSTAEEYDIPYHESKTFYGALQSHYRTLKRLGQEVIT